jgi:hypothetical protein
MMHAWPDNMTISAYHGIHRRPYDFLSHPMAPCSSPTTPVAKSETTTGASASTSAPLLRIIARTIASSPTPTPRAFATASCFIRPLSSSQEHHDLTNSFSSPNDWSSRGASPSRAPRSTCVRRMPTKAQRIPSRRRSQRSRVHAFTHRHASNCVHPSPPEHRSRN